MMARVRVEITILGYLKTKHQKRKGVLIFEVTEGGQTSLKENKTRTKHSWKCNKDNFGLKIKS